MYCKNVELIYITFLHAVMSTLSSFPEDINTEMFLSRQPDRTKIHRICQRILREGNGDHKYLRCPYLQDKFLGYVYRYFIYKVEFVCAQKDRAKPTSNYSGFITYSNTIGFSGSWLDNCSCLINECKAYMVKHDSSWFENW